MAKNADAEVGLAYVEEDAGLKVTGCKGALQAAVESGALWFFLNFILTSG